MPTNIKILAAAGTLAAAFFAGWQTNGWRLGEQIQDARANAAEAREAQQQADAQALDAVVEAAYQRTKRREVRTRTVTREVTRYVESEPDACELDPEWVRHHNHAAADPAGEPYGPAGGLTTTDALPVVTDNYLRCYEWRDRLIGLQDWVRRTRDGNRTPAWYRRLWPFGGK